MSPHPALDTQDYIRLIVKGPIIGNLQKEGANWATGPCSLFHLYPQKVKFGQAMG